ncbi:MAG TPA: hypothetical protein VHS96_05475 [Bacteroidia bacterium]|nr:hypothetical protein [Bacteroidia bacterium]
MAQLFRFLAKQSVYSETALLGDTGQTKRVKNLQIEQLGQELVAFIGEGNPDVIVFQILTVAPQLIENRLERQAAELIEWGISLAEQTENYHAVQSLWRLAELFPDPRPRFRGMTYEHALACAGNLVAYRQLEVRLRLTPTIPELDERRAVLEEIEASLLLESPGMALGYEARLLYWRIKAICKYLTKNYEAAIAPQANLVETLAERHDQDLDLARRWIRECSTLAVLHGNVGNLDAAKRLWDAIWNFPTNQFILECEKTKQIYPTKIAAGIDFGDAAFADRTCKEVNLLLSDRPELFPPGLQCQSLYYCASYYLSASRLDDASRTLARLRSIPRLSFPPIIYSMSKLLEIVLEIEQLALDDAIRLIKNLKMSKHDRSLAGIATGIHLLSAVAGFMSEPDGNFSKLPEQTSVQQYLAELKGQPVLDFFDLGTWVNAKSKGCPMMEVIQLQTSRRLR